MGKTGFAKAFVIPTLVCGSLLLIIGLGLVYSNKSRIASFSAAYERDASAFVQSEITRAEQTIASYQRIVFRAIPLIIIVAILFIAFINKPGWQASGITIIAMMVVLMVIDGNAKARMESYHQQLELLKNK